MSYHDKIKHKQTKLSFEIYIHTDCTNRTYLYLKKESQFICWIYGSIGVTNIGFKEGQQCACFNKIV